MKIASSNIIQGSYHKSEVSVEHQRQQEILTEEDFQHGVYQAQAYDYQSQTTQYSSNSVSRVQQNSLETTLRHQSSIVESSESEIYSTVDITSWRAPQNENSTGDIEFVRVINHQVFKSEERLIFESVGEVTTADGRSIDFLMQTDFTRQYEHESQGEFIASNSNWIDPLVISLTGQVPQMTDGSFEFDLTGDGKKEIMGNLSKGTGYIAFDKNNDGVINDGTELFGATTGAGFDELALYDDDGNGWIDENDAIFSRLSVWQPQTNDDTSLISFTDAQVGAIFLQSSDVEFTFKNEQNRDVARITQGGAALLESGQATHVFQLEWAQPIGVGSSLSWETIANSSFGIITEVGRIDPNTFSMAPPTDLQINSPTGLTTQAASRIATSSSVQTVFSNTSVESNYVQANNSPAVDSGVQPTTSKNDSENPSSTISLEKYDETKDEKVIQLRAVIEALKEMRENNQRQREVLDKKLNIE